MQDSERMIAENGFLRIISLAIKRVEDGLPSRCQSANFQEFPQKYACNPGHGEGNVLSSRPVVSGRPLVKRVHQEETSETSLKGREASPDSMPRFRQDNSDYSLR